MQTGKPPLHWVVLPIPSGLYSIDGAVAGPDGAIWFTAYQPSACVVGRVAMDGAITTYGAPCVPGEITLGPDANMWFTIGGAIGKVTPLGGVTIYSLSGVMQTTGITSGPGSHGGRSLWITAGRNRILEFSTKGRVITVYHSPSQPRDIGEGPDGNLWFPEYATGKMARMTPAGVFTEFPFPDGPVGRPGGIAAAKDGNLYTVQSESGYGKLIQVSTAGVVKQIDIGDNAPPSVSTGPDGNPWFYGEYHGLAHYDTTKQVVVRAGFPPNQLPGHNGLSITAGPDGNVWLPVADTDLKVTLDVYVRHIMQVSPNSVTLKPAEHQILTVKESRYSKQFSATSSDPNIATVSPQDRASFDVAAVSVGTCTITVSDSMGNSTSVPVTVQR